jgi:internalin A
MSEKQPNEPMSFSRFADWCRHIDSLSQEARHTVKVLLEKAGTDDPEAAQQILSSMTTLDLTNNQITDISFLGSLTNLTTLDLSWNRITDFSFLGSLTNLTRLDLCGNQNYRYQLPRLAHQSDNTASQPTIKLPTSASSARSPI